MNTNYPTRNEARSILKYLYTLKPSVSTNELTSYCILLFNKKDISATFLFTNSMVDMFSDSNSDSESAVEVATSMGLTPRTLFTQGLMGGKINGLSTSEIETFFLNNFGETLEELINIANNNELIYRVKFNPNNTDKLNIEWFNNCQRFIHPLLSSYADFKTNRGMSFDTPDVKQIPIDYSIALSYNHYRDGGYLNKYIVKDIVKILVDATNQALGGHNYIKYDEIEKVVFRDLEKPANIRSAFDFINKI